MGLSRRVARLGKNEKRGSPYRLRICARRTSIAVQSMRGPIGKAPMRRSTASKAFSNGGLAYEDDILEDSIL
jgi:hypothetical protein